MNYRRLGTSGLEVSPICLGTMMFGDRTDTAEAARIVAHAADAGINFIDTADAYATGESERIVGSVIRERRADWILATKVGNPVAQGRPHDSGSSRRWLLRACDDSLRRLATDWIDVYYLHRDDYGTAVAETVATLGDLIRAGKIRYFGISNFRGYRIADVVRECDRLGVPRPAVSQPYYNLLNRQPEVEVLPACAQYGIGVASYSPIARGVLTGKYTPGAAPAEDTRAGRKDTRMMQTEFREESLAIARTLAAHAEGTGRTALQFAMAWLWANPLVTSVIAGPRTLAQWEQYVAAIGTPWNEADEALVDELVRPGHSSTHGYNDPSYPILGRPRA